jgi:hypothetical protein
MKRLILSLAVIAGLMLAVSTANAVQPPSSGPHYNLNVIGFAKCTMTTDGVYPDCFNGQTGPGGNVIFVPIKTSQTQDICATTDPIVADPTDVTVAELKKGVRILVTDAFGDDLLVIDKDATDGTATFNLPDGCYQIFASPGGKPGGCMDVDTIICYDLVNDVLTQVDCRTDLTNDKFVLVGHINVDRSTGKPKWENVTSELLNSATGVGNGDPGYFDFFWEIYNQYLRVMHLRIQSVPCG